MSRKLSAAVAVTLMVIVAVAAGGVLIPLIAGGVSYTIARGGRP